MQHQAIYIQTQTVEMATHANWAKHLQTSVIQKDARVVKLRACLHGVGDPGLVGLVSFVFTLCGTQNKRNLPHQTGFPHSM